MAKEKLNEKSKSERIQELLVKYHEGVYVSIPADILEEMKGVFVEVYRRALCTTCSGDIVNGLYLLLQKYKE